MPSKIVDESPWLAVDKPNPPVPYHLRPTPTLGTANRPIVLDIEANDPITTNRSTNHWLMRMSDEVLERLLRICLDMPPDGPVDSGPGSRQRGWNLFQLESVFKQCLPNGRPFSLYSLLQSGSHRISKTAFRVFFIESHFRMLQWPHPPFPASFVNPRIRQEVPAGDGRNVLSVYQFRGWQRMAMKRLTISLHPQSASTGDFSWIEAVSVMPQLGFYELEVFRIEIMMLGLETSGWRAFFRSRLENSCDGLMAKGKKVSIEFIPPAAEF